MALWIELHCDVKSKNVDRLGQLACYSQSSQSPGVITWNTNKHMTNAAKYLKTQAVNSGWIKNHAGWCCPACRDGRE